ncbi:hypothetical protein EJB05_11679, partial [Eragrostis curvula]
MMDPLSSCGAKRARTALGGETSSALPSSHGSCTRDWVNLCGDGPTGLIAELVLAGGDVADYVRFRAVCSPWRRCSPAPRDLPGGGLDRRLFPRRWIMLDKALVGPRCQRFLNISTGKCIRMDLPELDDEHRFLALTPEGLLLLLHESTPVVRLLNPLTRQLIDLPPITGLLTREQRQARRLGHDFAPDLRVDGVGIVADDATMVIVRFLFPTVLAIAKPGSERWTVVNSGNISSTIIFAGRFYCTTSRAVMMPDMH